LGSESLPSLSYIWKPPSSCFIVTSAVTLFTNAANAPASSHPSLAVCAWATFILIWAKHKSIDWMTAWLSESFLPLLLVFHLLSKCWSFSSSLVSNLAKENTNSDSSLPGFIW
jgi:hypothetical protein